MSEDMMFLMYGLPDWIIVLAVSCVITVMSVVIMIVLHRLLFALTHAHTYDLGMRVMSSVIAMATFVVGFSTVQVRGEVSKLEQTIEVEAKAIGQLDRLLNRFNRESGMAARATLREYASSIIKEEWPAMARGRESFKTGELIHRLSNEVSALDPQTDQQSTLYSEIIRNTDSLEDMRDQRIRSSVASLSPLFWVVILSLTALAMAIGALFKPSRLSLMLIACQGAGLGLMIGLLVVMNEPFLGNSTLTAKPFERVLQTGMSNR